MNWVPFYLNPLFFYVKAVYLGIVMGKHETELAKISLMHECSYSYRPKLVVEC